MRGRLAARLHRSTGHAGYAIGRRQVPRSGLRDAGAEQHRRPSGHGTGRQVLAMKRLEQAYSMIELLTVLVIVAVLLGLALPEMSRMIASYRLKAAVSDLHGAIDLTRSQAIARGRR